MYYKDPTFTVFLHDAPKFFGELATELDSPLITLEPGMYEVEKGGFTLRVYYVPSHPWPEPQSSGCGVALSPTRLKDLPGGRPGGPFSLAHIMRAFGQSYRHDGEYMAAKIKSARDAVKTYCLPIMMGDLAGWNKIVGYINTEWVLHLEKKSNPDAGLWR